MLCYTNSIEAPQFIAGELSHRSIETTSTFPLSFGPYTFVVVREEMPSGEITIVRHHVASNMVTPKDNDPAWSIIARTVEAVIAASAETDVDINSSDFAITMNHLLWQVNDIESPEIDALKAERDAAKAAEREAVKGYFDLLAKSMSPALTKMLTYVLSDSIEAQSQIVESDPENIYENVFVGRGLFDPNNLNMGFLGPKQGG